MCFLSHYKLNVLSAFSSICPFLYTHMYSVTGFYFGMWTADLCSVCCIYLMTHSTLCCWWIYQLQKYMLWDKISGPLSGIDPWPISWVLTSVECRWVLWCVCENINQFNLLQVKTLVCLSVRAPNSLFLFWAGVLLNIHSFIQSVRKPCVTWWDCLMLTIQCNDMTLFKPFLLYI